MPREFEWLAGCGRLDEGEVARRHDEVIMVTGVDFLLGSVPPVVKMPDTEARKEARLLADTISIMH